MKSNILSVLLFFSCFIAKSQCFEIESILVDGCDGSNEGMNEMVRFKVGAAPLSVSTLTVNWPNNSWLGICQSASTATSVAAINSTILGCGFLKEPISGVLPANSKVLLVTSTGFNPFAQSFTNLTDTLIIIFQCAGNTAGHFANYVAATSPSPLRTLSMSFSGGCSDAVTYNRNNLTKQNGTIGGQDGGAVEFSAAGNPTYVNRGCTAPFIPITVNAGPDRTLCSNLAASFTATVSGTTSGTIQWSGGTGTFSNPTAATTSYTPGAGETGTVNIFCTVTKSCSTQTLTAKDTVVLSILQIPQPVISANSTTLCAGQSSTLSFSLINASVAGATTNTWLPSNSNASSISVNTANIYTLQVSNACGIGTNTMNISTAPGPTISISANSSPEFCVGSSVVLTANSTEGNYQWNTGATTQTISVSSSTTVVVTTTSTCGNNQASLTTTVIPLPTVTLSANTLTACAGSTLSLTATSNTGNYSWNNPASTNSMVIITANTSTIGAVTSTNICGSTSDNYVLTVTPIPTVALNVDMFSVCAGNSVTLTAMGNTSNYSWSNSGSTSSTIAVIVNATTTGTVTASNACGSASDSFTINVTPNPTLTVSNSNVNLCGSQTETVTAFSSIGTYTWMPGSINSNSIVVNSAGTYTVYSGNSCKTESVVVNVVVNSSATLSITASSSSVCANGAAASLLSLNGSVGTYTWNTGVNTSTISVNLPGVYSATVDAGSCGIANASYTVGEIASPTLSAVASSSLLCNGANATITANSNINNYNWSNGTSNVNSIIVNSTGIYTVGVSNACGTASAAISINAAITPTINLTASSLTICPNETATLTVTGGNAPYNWSHTSNTGSIVTTSGGIVSVTYTNICGSSTQTVNVFVEPVSASISANPASGTKPLVVYFSNNSVGANSYNWNFGNGNGATTQTVSSQTYSVSGNYWVYLTVSNGTCTDMDSLMISVDEDEPWIIIPNVFTPNGDNSNDVFKITGYYHIIDFNCAIFDRWGLKMFEWSDIKQGWDGTRSGNKVPDGTYFYILNAKDIDGKEFQKQGPLLLIR